ncbi:MAG TPA: hypothetical protein VGC40_04995 [Paenirhodobacter sp.]
MVDTLPEGAVQVQARVDICEALGPTSIIWCDIAGQRCSFSVPGTVSYPAGTVMDLFFFPGSVSLFDAETENRI